MNVSKVKVGISCVASGLVFQSVNQALCVHIKLSNRVEMELMDVDPSPFCLRS